MTWIKICGMTTPAAVDTALETGVDAIGFVFAPSPRQLTPQAAAGLAGPARGRIACIAVMRHPTQDSLEEILERFRPDALQTDLEDLRTLQIPQQLEVLPVIRLWQDEARQPRGRVLFEAADSGVGMRADWDGASRLARQVELILAGGLTPANVVTAMTAVRPFGVDVSSGVERERAIKDPAEIRRFVSAVRAHDQAGSPHVEEKSR